MAELNPTPVTTLEPLPWLGERFAELGRLADSGRLPHALLISGPRGVGKRSLVDALAARTLCANPGRVACGHCHGCHMLASGYHPDLMSVELEEGKRQIRIDAIREINHFVAQTAQQGGYRVILVAPAEALNVAAANALLKSLEEPGARTLFLLLSDIPSRLLPTIRSRCQHWSLAIPEPADCLPWLAERLGDNEEATFWLRVAGGLPLQAVSLSTPEARALRQQLVDTFEALVRGGEPVAEAARLDRQSIDAILWYGIAWLEDLIRLGLSGDASGLCNPDLLPLYRQAVKNARVRDWFRLLDYAREERRLLAAGGNPNPQLVLEAWLVRWSALLRS
ncbi:MULTISPECIES: DNA polymerase III subunit delta' [unclassified Halomonas]|uniref:DNA polymerase III subunit delta' n=1 Tax=unclassified Halomonas TaxID=2609666 RepID=UPI0028839122|nr:MULTISPECIES: DNA polymerase III subunit delta' [unclassified Halomonas]MDT0501187.1 DNA polymerase III subunit delta' [Halomonas sp. PAR7]MDT0511434.1 DNA polymerase III subunit delta' [Halomonas sp. LES1]MDT0590278.1 DNA polymerase III subunit delta' [Halomonas sp. PAR8]